jgi:hypothetical protein
MVIFTQLYSTPICSQDNISAIYDISGIDSTIYCGRGLVFYEILLYIRFPKSIHSRSVGYRNTDFEERPLVQDIRSYIRKTYCSRQGCVGRRVCYHPQEGILSVQRSFLFSNCKRLRFEGSFFTVICAISIVCPITVGTVVGSAVVLKVGSGVGSAFVTAVGSSVVSEVGSAVVVSVGSFQKFHHPPLWWQFRLW